MNDEWLFPHAVVPVDADTTAALVAEIKRLIDVVGSMALAQSAQEHDPWRMAQPKARPTTREEKIVRPGVYEQKPVPDALGHVGFQEWWDAVADDYEVNDFKKMRRAWSAAMEHEAPPAAQRPWVGLTQEDKETIYEQADAENWHDQPLLETVEAKLKERNT